MLGLILVIFLFFRVTRVVGTSMEPSLADGQRGLIMLNRFKVYTPSRYDVVLVKKGDEDKVLVKRVIGLPGDKVEIKENCIFINGTPMREEYVKEEMFTEDLSIVLGEDEIFILGDNRNVSRDSRDPNIGAVKYKEEVLAKFILDLKDFSYIDI